ncbi:MAG: ThiF family adenylyltransferase [Chloroflexi bacterium]|nr:ThiF family adenylyltransferase [Chloroflexota bacterium]
MTSYSVAWRAETELLAREHLLQHYERGELQEDIALATWYPADGTNRRTAIIDEVLLPTADERILQGNVQLTPQFLRRGRDRAVSKGAGLAVMHNHFGPGWQHMSADDVIMESRSVSNPARATQLPVVGLTLGTDGTWSARFWIREGSTYDCRWCSTIRIISPDHLSLQFNPQLFRPVRSDDGLGRFRRSIEAWGADSQELLGRLTVGIVGLGSVGALAAETMGRMGIRGLVLVDMDRIEHHNLDRLLHSGPSDVGRYKVQLSAEHLARITTKEFHDLRALPLSLRDTRAYRAIADCDVILGCADKPVARDLLNHLAVCHLIPVIEAGVALRSRHGALHKGHVVSQIVTPDSRCLRCTRQYTTDLLSLEVEGLLEDPEYIQALPSHQRPNTANVFPASLSAASMQAALFTRLLLGPHWWLRVYQQQYHLSVASQRTASATCDPYCDVHARRCLGNLGEPQWLLWPPDSS